MKGSIVIREIGDSDYEKLAEFNSTFPGDDRSKSEWLERYKIWWDDNPAYVKGHPRGIVALYNNKIIGTTNNFPTKMIWDNKETTVINGSTWRVNQDFRKISMDIWHKHREITKGFILLNTTAIPKVVKLLKILKFTEYFVTDKWYYYFGDYSQIDETIKLRLISFFQKFILSISVSPKSNIEIVKTVKDISQIDNLWNKHKHDYGFTNIRNSSYIKWLSRTNDIFYMYSGNELLGFFIMHFNQKKKTFMLVDFWPSRSTKQIGLFIKYLLKKYKHYNIIIPSFNETCRKNSQTNILIGRKKKTSGFIHFGKEKAIDYDNSYLTMLQGDFGI